MLVYVYTSKAFDDNGELKRVERTDILEDSINIDYDANNEIVGIEILDAQRITSEVE